MAVIRGTERGETLSGTAAADSLIGLGGNDRLLGRDGNDSLNGGNGADILNGGEGTDTASYGAERKAVFVDFDTGTVSTVSGDDELISVENVAGSNFDDQFFGDDGTNIFRGRGGDDTFDGAGGDDTLNGGGGSDTAVYRNASAALAVELRTGVATSDLGRDTLIAIENVDGGGGDDRLFGSNGANVLFGDEGADDLRGRGGDDVLQGGLGADSFVAGGGNDLVDGGAGRDTVRLGAGSDNLRYVLVVDQAEDDLALRAGADVVLDFSRRDDVIGGEVGYILDSGEFDVATGDRLFEILDSNGNAQLDNNDTHVDVRNVTIGANSLRSTIIDFGSALNELAGSGLIGRGTNTLTVFGVTGMQRSDFFGESF